MTGGNVGLNLTLSGLGQFARPGQFAPVQVQLGTATLPLPPVVASLLFGAASGQMNLLVCQSRGLQAGASETLDLFTGTDAKDIDGQTAAFRLLKWAIFWVIAGGDSTGVTVGNAASNAQLMTLGGTTPTATIYPSGPPLLLGSPAGSVVDASHKNLKVLNNSPTALVTYGLLLAGCDTAAPTSGAEMGLPLGPTYP